MQARSWISMFLVTLALLFHVAPSLAQASSEDSAAARALFAEAQKKMAKEDYPAAFDLLASALKLDKKKGILFNYAICAQRLNKLTTAWNAYQEAVALSKGAYEPRVADAVRQIAAIEPKLSKLKIDLPDAAKGPGLVVSRDGTNLPSGIFGIAVPLDAGEHTLVASMPGRKDWTKKITLSAPGVVTVTVPVLDPLQVDAPKPAAVAPIATLPAKETPAAAPVPFWSKQRIAGVAVAGVGVVGLAVGAAFGGLAIADKSSAGAHCTPAGSGGGASYCDKTGLAKWSDEKTMGNVSTAGIVVGAVALAAGITIFATAPKGPKDDKKATAGLHVSPTFAAGPATAAIGLEGAW